jgi:hypothetical protein
VLFGKHKRSPLNLNVAALVIVGADFATTLSAPGEILLTGRCSLEGRLVLQFPAWLAHYSFPGSYALAG